MPSLEEEDRAFRPRVRAWRDPECSSVDKVGAVRIRLLGRFRVSVGPRVVEEGEWRLKKAASLVKLLALAENHRLHRERVMDLLWPDLASKAAANNLYYVLYVARRLLEPEVAALSYLRLHDERITLCPDSPLWVDVEAFEEAAETARCAQVPAAYRTALELYTGDLLAEDPYDGWAESRREKLRREYVSLLLELAGLGEERGEPDRAIETLKRAVDEGMTYEEACAGLMGTAGAQREVFGTVLMPVESSVSYAPHIAAARALLSEATWEKAWTEGRAISQEEALEYALGPEELAPLAVAPVSRFDGSADDPLSCREREVADLVAQGLTNRRLGSELVISERTVETYVRRIFKKLNLNCRAQIVAWVVERRLHETNPD